MKDSEIGPYPRVPPNATPQEIAGLIKGLLITIIPLLRPYFFGGVALGGYPWISMTLLQNKQIHPTS